MSIGEIPIFRSILPSRGGGFLVRRRIGSSHAAAAGGVAALQCLLIGVKQNLVLLRGQVFAAGDVEFFGIGVANKLLGLGSLGGLCAGGDRSLFRFKGHRFAVAAADNGTHGVGAVDGDIGIFQAAHGFFVGVTVAVSGAYGDHGVVGIHCI